MSLSDLARQTQFIDGVGQAELVASGKVSASELLEATVERYSAFNPSINAINITWLDHARELAKKFKPSANKKFGGVPFVLKDLGAPYAGQHMSNGNIALKNANYIAPTNSNLVQKFIDSGLITFGRTNSPEFGSVPVTEPLAWGPTRNPFDVNRTSGGSSGGSAAAVAGCLAPLSLGSDTGGSIRQPASLCGITGIKPTYGSCSRYGMIAYASSLDQAGPMAHSARDCALVLNAMVGFDAKDSTSVQRPVLNEDFTAGFGKPIRTGDAAKPLAGVRVGLPAEFFGEGLTADVRAPIDAALKQLEAMGATLVNISLPRTELSIPAYYVIAPAEASSNLSRFDGVRYGHRAADYTDLKSMYENSRSEGFGLEVQRRIMVGAYVLSHGYYDAYYLQAQKIRRLIAQDFQAAFQQCDFIAGPVSPTVAWNLGEKSADPVQMYLADIYTLSTSLAGLPGMSVPVGFGDRNRPVGMQLIGNYFKEGELLALADHYQAATDWHLRTPS